MAAGNSPTNIKDLKLELMKTWQLSNLKEYSGTGMSWIKAATGRKAPQIEISGDYRFPYAFDVGKDKEIIRGQMNRVSGVISIGNEDAENLSPFDDWADWAHDQNKDEWWGPAYPRRGFHLNEIVKRSFRKDRESKDPRNPYKMGPDGKPLEDLSMRFKAAYRYPNETRFRYAGVWDDGAGGIVEEPATQMAVDPRTGQAIEGSEVQMMPAPPEWNETRFLIVDEETGNTYDKTVVQDENGENATCAKTGRFLYRYFGPEDVPPGSTLTKLVLEVNALYFSGGTGRGVSFKAREVHFKPRQVAQAGGGGDEAYNPADYGASAPLPPTQASRMTAALAAATKRDDEDGDTKEPDEDFERGETKPAVGKKRGRARGGGAASQGKRTRGGGKAPPINTPIPDELDE